MSSPFVLAAIGSFRDSGPSALNWLFLIESIVVVILVIFYFFYFNRILALVVAFFLRLFFWKSNNAYFDIDSIQFSLIGGRIDFSGLRYISRNQSLRVLNGSISWRYWIWRVRSEEDKLSEAQTPCRLTVAMQGAEWFLYNRTPSYDAILEQLGVVDPLSHARTPMSSEASANHEKYSSSKTSDREVPVRNGEEESEVGEEIQHVERKTTDWLREALPIEFKCFTGSIIMGNNSTQSILIAGFVKAEGSYSAVKSRSRFDEYKQVYRITFTQPKVVYRTNPDYEGPLAKHGEKVLERLQIIPGFNLKDFLSQPAHHGSLKAFASLLRKIPSLVNPIVDPDHKSSEQYPPSHWTGLPRYQTAAQDSNPQSSLPHRVEYAKVMTLLTSPELEMTYYCDTVGKVPEVARMVTGFKGLETCDIGNGDLSPEWGVDLVIKGGAITYGPWADRQRSELQQAFIPATFYNATQTPALKAGDLRMHTALKVFVEFSEGATLRIPTREISKDWKYDTLATESLGGSTVRPYGWLDISLGSNSTLSYVMPTVATEFGYDTLLEFHLDEMSVASSVNYANFLKAETCRVHCGFPSPLVWNDLRTWTINVTVSKPDISLLRDHITLIADLAKDFTSGPSGDYEHFVPCVYVFNLNISELALKLFVNDHNIINNSTTAEDNTLLICRTPRVVTSVIIPSDSYKMECSTITFNSIATNLALSMTLPDWNTHNAFLTENTKNFAITPELSVEGAYRFYATADPDHVERLNIAIECCDVIFKTMGWMIRHMFNLRDNYFGSFTHFVTLEEYRHRHENNIQGDPLELKYRPGATDVFEVALTLQLVNGLMLIPAELFDCQSAVVFVLPQLQIELRNHDYFMELALNLDPFRIVYTSDSAALIKQSFSSLLVETDSIRVQGLEVTANRLFGPQPRTSTYICIWSIYLGSTTGNVPPSFLQALTRSMSALAVNFNDQDNSLPADFTVALDPDATFVTVNLGPIDLAVRGQGTAIQLDLENGMKIRFDDLATRPFLKTINIEIPTLVIRFLAPLFGRAAPWMEVASLDADFSILLGLSESGWEDKAERQLEYIAIQDITKRCPFLYGGGEGVSSHVGSLFLPALPPPIKNHHQNQSSQANFYSASSSSESIETDESDSRSESSFSNDSESSEDNYEAIYSQLPGRRAGEGNRFSAYGSILRLCERAPEGSLLDRPTFSRLGRQSNDISSQDLPSAKQRIEKLGEIALKESHSRTSIDIASRKPIRLVVTPVAVQVGADVLENMPVDENLEHCLDDLFTTYVSNQTPSNSARYSTLQINTTIPSIQIDSIQDVLRPEDTISIKSTADDTRSTILCTATITIDLVEIFMETTDDRGVDRSTSDLIPTIIARKFSASAERTHLEVFHPQETSSYSSKISRIRHILPPTENRQHSTALDLEIGPCQSKLNFLPEKAAVALNGGEARLEFVDEAAELVIGSLWSWRVLQDVAEPLVERRTRSLQFSRSVVRAIVNTSDKSSITTFPTFLSRVSYLVGNSTNLRGDDGWKILSQLRHCLRLSPNTPITIEDQEPTPLDLFNNVVDVVSRWRAWEIDASNLVEARFISTLFGQSSAQSPIQPLENSAQLNWDIPIELEWTAGRFAASLSDGKTSDNWMVAGPISAFVVSSGRTCARDSLDLTSRITFETFDANVDRDVLLLVRHIIKVRNTFERKIQLFREGLTVLIPESNNHISNQNTSNFFSGMPRTVVSASLGIRGSELKATAGNLESSALLQNLSTSISILFEPKLSRNSRPMSHQVDANASFTIGETSLAARDGTSTQQEPLLSIEFDELSLIGNAVGSHTWDGGRMDLAPSLQLILACQSIRGRIPREAIRVYEFIDTWKVETLPAYDSLLLQLRQGLDDIQSVAIPNSDDEPSFIELLSAKANLSTQLCISSLAFEFQAIPTLAMGYYIQDFIAHAKTEDGAKGRGKSIGALDAGLMISSQTIRFIPITTFDSDLNNLTAETSFNIPILRLKAHLDGIPFSKINFLVTIDPISIKLTSSILDNILTVQNRFGSDIDELVNYYRSRQSVEAVDLVVEEVIPSKLVWDARVAFQGLKIGLEGPQAIQWIEVELLEGYASSVESNSSMKLNWEASAQNLSISLSQRSLLDRGHRLAFFSLDLSVNNSVIELPELSSNSNDPHLHLKFPRIHAVLQPSAVDALGDLIEHFQDELEIRRSSQREDVNAIRQRVLQTFEVVGDKPVDVEESLSWLATCIISVEARDIGLAIPLNSEVAASSQLPKSKATQSHPAFLVTLPLLNFSTRKGEAATATTKSLAFQFVHKFDQAREEDFDPRSHKSINSVVFPHMQCVIRCPVSGTFIAQSVVSGLELNIEASAIGLAFLLIDVYQLSQERFAKYANLSKSESIPAAAASVPRPALKEALPYLIRANFEFESGVISMHSKQSSYSRQIDSTTSPRPSRPSNHRTGRSLSDFSHFRTSSIKPLASDISAHIDVFRLPGISVRSEYHEGILPSDTSNLHFDISIHSSNNQLSPSLIPFISECASQLKSRALQSAAATSSVISPTYSTTFTTSSSSSRLQIGISLKLDQSRLDITCQPAAPVTATLTWVSGGVLISISPDVKGIEISSTIDGVAFTLAHDFSPEKCLSAEVTGITGNIVFQAPDQGVGNLSICVDVPDISADCNFRHLQDYHCLKAIWFDRMDLGPPLPKAPAENSLVTTFNGLSSAPPFVLTTLVLARFQTVKAVLDLGQSIGKSTFIVHSINGRLRWNESKYLSIGVGGVEVGITGRATGDIKLGGILFETRLRDIQEQSGIQSSDLLHIKIGLGTIDASLEYEFHKILLMHMDPIAISVLDDWSRVTTRAAELELAFEVKMRTLSIIATISTVPSLVSFVKRIQSLLDDKSFQADATIKASGLQAPRPSVAFKNVDAVSAVASKLSINRLDPEHSIRILSDLDIDAEAIRIAIFHDHFNDGEVFRADAGGIRAKFCRDIDAQETIHRDLTLHLGFFSIRKVQYRTLIPSLEASYTVQEWYELLRNSNEKNIFKVPTTEVRMISNQKVDTLKIEHDFLMEFVGEVSLALNYALFRNLQSLANSYQVLMDNVLVDAENRSAIAGTPTTEKQPFFSQPSTLLEVIPGTDSVTALNLTNNIVERKSRSLQFIAKSLKVEQPKLVNLGEATPPLEWLGLQTASFPQYIHQGVTLTLEELLLFLTSTYETQLARQKLKQRSKE